MGGASAVSITNWDKMQKPAYDALHQNWVDRQANAKEWNEHFEKELEAWKERRKAEWTDYKEEQEKWRLVEYAIIAAQKVIALYFADKQYQAAKEAQDHQNEVWETEKKWAERYQDLWFNKYRPVEEQMLAEKANQEKYTPRYDEVEARAVTTVRREFANAREQARQCIDPRCIGMLCSTNKELAIAEARATVGAVNKAYRAEEARKDMKDAQRDETIFALLQLGRGLQTSSLNSLNSAAEAARIAATYKPYEGYATALGSIFGEARGWAADRRVSAGNNADIISRQIGAYSMLMPKRSGGYANSTTIGMPISTIRANPESIY